MKTGIVLINFGEPSSSERDDIIEYLTRIFLANADLEGSMSDEDSRRRARVLAERRAPNLQDEYDQIGGSPLNTQARSQARNVEAELTDRGYEVSTYSAMQFTDPLIGDIAESLRKDGIEHVIGVPVYPLCGPSTTVASLASLETAIRSIEGWDPTLDEVTGWHRHPRYNRLRADNIMRFLKEHRLSLDSHDLRFVFSAHGTPRHYLETGSRYDLYVREFVKTMASMIGLSEYEIGYQNHENRDVPWTEPAIEAVVSELSEGIDRIVVEPVSFMHEQSETLSELDIELEEEANERGIELFRVPVPYDDDRFPSVLADLVEPFLAGFDPGYYRLRQCICRNRPGSLCLNAPDPTDSFTDD